MTARAVFHLVAAAVSLGAIAGWLATGREAFTRWPDARLEAADRPATEAEGDLLADIGLADESAPARIESRFALGLLPSGADPRHLVSVATAVATSLALSGAGLLKRRTPMEAP